MKPQIYHLLKCNEVGSKVQHYGFFAVSTSNEETGEKSIIAKFGRDGPSKRTTPEFLSMDLGEKLEELVNVSFSMPSNFPALSSNVFDKYGNSLGFLVEFHELSPKEKAVVMKKYREIGAPGVTPHFSGERLLHPECYILAYEQMSLSWSGYGVFSLQERAEGKVQIYARCSQNNDFLSCIGVDLGYNNSREFSSFSFVKPADFPDISVGLEFNHQVKYPGTIFFRELTSKEKAVVMEEIKDVLASRKAKGETTFKSRKPKKRHNPIITPEDKLVWSAD